MSSLVDINRRMFPRILLIACLLSMLTAKTLPIQQAVVHPPQVDPFYLRLFDEGLSAFNRGDFEEAFENLKIAAFGLLDEPDLLGEAFVYLTLSAYNLKKTDQVEHYLREISRFKLNNRIRGSRLPEKIKDQFARIQSSFKNSLTG
ncbi:MAG: hypothetical protein QME85_05895 [Candidatus Saccharicenans sp.]|nr:hypothetical protein [Candidatus Saccharicenans sp.]MDI6848202.1 hypothetical protein [Candidatus Saccharicenans sp.]